MKYLSFLLLLAMSPALKAIDYFQPGDTLYVWAASGLVLRKTPSLDGARLKSIPYGTQLLALNYSGDKRTEVEAVPGFAAKGVKYPAVRLRGDFARVAFGGDTGYVFNGYLSKLPSLLRFPAAQPDRPPVSESFEAWGKRNFGVIARIERGKMEYGTPYSLKTVFGNGIITDTWTEKDAEGRTILPDISMEEAFLIFNYMEQYEWEIRHIPQEETEDPWSFNRASDQEWGFSEGGSEYKILYLQEEKLAVITSHAIE